MADFDCNDFLDTDFAVDTSCDGGATVWWRHDEVDEEYYREQERVIEEILYL